MLGDQIWLNQLNTTLLKQYNSITVITLGVKTLHLGDCVQSVICSSNMDVNTHKHVSFQIQYVSGAQRQPMKNIQTLYCDYTTYFILCCWLS